MHILANTANSTAKSNVVITSNLGLFGDLKWTFLLSSVIGSLREGSYIL